MYIPKGTGDETRPIGIPTLEGKVLQRAVVMDLVGFTHFWGRSRKGTWVVKRRTAADRLRRAIRKIADYPLPAAVVVHSVYRQAANP